jgi:hypothetical protein
MLPASILIIGCTDGPRTSASGTVNWLFALRLQVRINPEHDNEHAVELPYSCQNPKWPVSGRSFFR